MRGWAGLALLLVGGGCLLPYPEDPAVLPPERNRPPRIEERNVTPGRIVHLSPDRCEQTFSLQVADPDLRDTLYVHWYVDFDPASRTGQNPLAHQNTIQPNPSSRQDTDVRDQSATFTLDTTTGSSPIAMPGEHLVEAYVADAPLHVLEEDGAMVIRPTNEVTTPADGGLPDRKFVVSYAWFVITPQGCPTGGSQ